MYLRSSGLTQKWIPVITFMILHVEPSSKKTTRQTRASVLIPSQSWKIQLTRRFLCFWQIRKTKRRQPSHLNCRRNCMKLVWPETVSIMKFHDFAIYFNPVGQCLAGEKFAEQSLIKYWNISLKGIPRRTTWKHLRKLLKPWVDGLCKKAAHGMERVGQCKEQLRQFASLWAIELIKYST